MKLLPAAGTYPAICCCVLTNGHMPHCTNTRLETGLPCVTDDGTDEIVGEITEGTLIGYKYFDFRKPVRLTLTYRADARCTLTVSASDGPTGQTAYASAQRDFGPVEVACPASADPGGKWETVSLKLDLLGKAPLFLRHTGGGKLELKSFTFD